MLENLLPSIWFALWGLLWAIYFALDGFDLGAGMLAGLFQDDRDRHVLIHSLGPVWDGNEVWLITAGGVTFAAFPKLYAVMFSSLYGPLMIILVALVLRAVSIEFYHLEQHQAWGRLWTNILAVASLLVALLFGVAFGNIFQGLPLDQAGYHGTVVGLLNPYGLLTGVLFVLAFLYNGGVWLAYKAADDELREKGLAVSNKLWPLLFLVAAAFLVYTPFATSLLANYLAVPALFVVPLVAVLMLVATRYYLGKERPLGALLTGSLAVLVTVVAGVIGLYPDMFPSAINPAYSLTAFNSASSTYTLKIMLIVTLIFLPVVLVYQVWFYKLFAGPHSEEEPGYGD